MMDATGSEPFEPMRPQPTGRMLMLFDEGADTSKARRTLENSTGLRTLDAREFGASAASDLEGALASGAAIVLPTFGVAVVSAPDQEGGKHPLKAAGQFVLAFLARFHERAVFCKARSISAGSTV